MARDLSSVLEAVLDGVLLVSRNGNIEDLNAEACRIFGVSAEAIRGQSIERLIEPGRAIVDLAHRVIQTGQPVVQAEVVYEHRSGKSFTSDVSVSPLHAMRSEWDGAGDLDGVVVVIRDRTITNSLREIVAHEKQLASYGQIASGIAHEVKNPLGGIRGAAELIERWTGDDRSHRAASMIVREVDRISHLVDELMVFARNDELAAAPTNLHQVLDSVIEVVRLDPISKGIGIERAYDPSIPDITADAARLEQVFLNLVRNALQATHAGAGHVQITTRMTLDERLTGHDQTSIPTVQVVVNDNGDGISPEVMDRLATPFFTTRENGTGLGLAVSRHWVTQHRGTLTITSPPGEGTTVRVNLPLTPSKGQALE